MIAADTPRARYDNTELTAAQLRGLNAICDWENWCPEPAIGVRLFDGQGRWVACCLGHVRMGSTVVVGVERVAELVGAAA